MAGGEAVRPAIRGASRTRVRTATSNERIFRSKRDGTFVEIGGYDGWTGSNWFDSRLRAVEIAFAKVDQRLATLERAIIPAAPPAE